MAMNGVAADVSGMNAGRKKLVDLIEAQLLSHGTLGSCR